MIIESVYLKSRNFVLIKGIEKQLVSYYKESKEEKVNWNIIVRIIRS
jgi:hypothetical protein